MVLVKENIGRKGIANNGGLLAGVLRMQIPRPPNYNWKEDYANALEEKYENIHRREYHN